MLRKRKDLRREALGLLQHGFTYGAIGSFFGLSRQRIQQALSPPLYIRRTLLRRAAGYCEVCRTNVGTSGHVHHISIQGDAYNSITNLRLLCASCHSKEHPSSPPKLQKKEKLQNPLRPTPNMNGSGRILVKKVLKGMTQESFAKIAEVSGATISLWLNGKRNMHPLIERHVRQVAEELLRKAS